MPKKTNTSDSNHALTKLSYKQLQELAINMALPANLKYIELLTVIVAKKNNDHNFLNAVLTNVQKQRFLKKINLKRGIDKQGSGVSSTTNKLNSSEEEQSKLILTQSDFQENNSSLNNNDSEIPLKKSKRVSNDTFNIDKMCITANLSRTEQNQPTDSETNESDMSTSPSEFKTDEVSRQTENVTNFLVNDFTSKGFNQQACFSDKALNNVTNNLLTNNTYQPIQNEQDFNVDLSDSIQKCQLQTDYTHSTATIDHHSYCANVNVTQCSTTLSALFADNNYQITDEKQLFKYTSPLITQTFLEPIYNLRGVTTNNNIIEKNIKLAETKTTWCYNNPVSSCVINNSHFQPFLNANYN